VYAAVLAAFFVVAAAVGYVYNHEPERDVVEVVIDRSNRPEGPRFVSGTVVELDGNRAVIQGDFERFEVVLSDVEVEELRALPDPTGVPVGAWVNLGGERTATERVISGVVLFGSGATP
jgi:hypothetical protein